MSEPAREPTSPTARNAMDPLRTQALFGALRGEMAKAVIGQNDFVEQLFLTLLCCEHALLEGPAGTAKWLAVDSLGKCCGLTSHRLRCSPDVTVADLEGSAAVGQLWGASLLLVDNIKRLPAKVCDMVQQAMQERTVTLKETNLSVADPFVVFAARDRDQETPVQQEMTDSYEDRFLFQINVPYPAYHEEYAMGVAKSGPPSEPAQLAVNADQLKAWQSFVQQIEAAPSVIHYAVRLVRATRVHEGENPDFVYEWVLQGAGPRAVHFLILAAKARATLRGRMQILHEDVRAMCLPVLRHRILVNQNAQTNGIGVDRVIKRLIAEIPPRVVGDDTIPGPGQSLTFHDWVPAGDGT